MNPDLEQRVDILEQKVSAQANEIERLRGALKQIYERSKSDDSWLSRSVDIRVIVYEALQEIADAKISG